MSGTCPGSRSTTWTTCSARWHRTSRGGRRRPLARGRSLTRRPSGSRAGSDAIVNRVLRENEPRWVNLSEVDRERVEAMARAIATRLLHEPTLRLKRSAGDESYAYLQAVRELFAIEVAVAPAPEEGLAASAEVTSLDSRRRRRSR
ncbi:MAG: hypothetical protein E6G07_12790 [Actinobacteria bacterium]|nr:MAG: hypothetical protein E6G07_12790 [Actinomycetota bacterium]